MHGYTTFNRGRPSARRPLRRGGHPPLRNPVGSNQPQEGRRHVSLGAAVASLGDSQRYGHPRELLYLDYICWGFFIGGAFAPITLLALGTLEERDVANGSTLRQRLPTRRRLYRHFLRHIAALHKKGLLLRSPERQSHLGQPRPRRAADPLQYLCREYDGGIWIRHLESPALPSQADPPGPGGELRLRSNL